MQPVGSHTETGKALRIELSGHVQGVGFRPFVHNLADRLRLQGWVRNTVGRVEIHVQGDTDRLQTFMRTLLDSAPSLARVQLDSCRPADTGPMQDFRIRDSVHEGEVSIHIPVDSAVCRDCLVELHDPHDRRYRYPFVNCTQCGPRYALIRSLPYDRANTTMQGFPLCPPCTDEYHDRNRRRFHAEPLACPDCGPTLTFSRTGQPTVQGNEAALAATLSALRAGEIIAVKGVAGYHLLCDAGSDRAVGRLRRRKQRPHKPLAVMCPEPVDAPLRHIDRLVSLPDSARALLTGMQRPIVLARRRGGNGLSDAIAPGLDEIGVMLPYSPLHHLLLDGFGTALVATSANLSGEPVLTDNTEAEHRLQGVADGYLHHDRPIARPADDPVYRVIAGRPRLLRPGRGCAPLELELPVTLPYPVLAVGGHMKNTIALAWENRIVISPHIGDMGTARSLLVFEQALGDLQSLYRQQAEAVLCDAHPGYTTTRWARRSGLPVHSVQHHAAHASVACPGASAARPALVLTWDGTGYGTDGTLWGGEALYGAPGNWQRFATLRPFRLPGGERAGREPWRAAAALCWSTGRQWHGPGADQPLLQQAWQQGVNSPASSAAGRLFDAVAALAGVCETASYEGQGPMQLEAASTRDMPALPLPLQQDDNGIWISDWEPLLARLLDPALDAAECGGLLHATMAQLARQQARLARELHGISGIGLCGGVFQNALLTGQVVDLLEQDGFSVHLPDRVPLNDAGLCYGQVIEFAAGTAG